MFLPLLKLDCTDQISGCTTKDGPSSQVKMSVEDLSQEECINALTQLCNNSNFDSSNPHLSQTQISRIRQNHWPNLPVYSPYSITHNGYSQIRLAGTKYLVHRVTYKAFTGLNPNQEVSHLLWVGIMRTANNVNPRFLIDELGTVNRSRQSCAMVVEKCMRKWHLGRFPASWSEDDLDNYIRNIITQTCSFLHNGGCSWNVKLWKAFEEEAQSDRAKCPSLIQTFHIEE